MKQKALAYLIIVALMPIAGMAQVDSTAADTLPAPSLPDTVVTQQPDTLESDSAIVLFKVRPWQYHAPLQADTAATDSSLRWQVWPSWIYKTNREPGVITYRLGSIGRTNAQQIGVHEPKYQQLYWEDIRLNDPVSGIANWNYIPHHKIKTIYERDLGTVHRTKFYLKDYYLNKPLTQLNYTESSFDTRSLEFVVSHNLSQKTNAEISYWDRRDGGEYNNSGVVGRQIYARVTHQIDKRQMLKVRFLNNHYDNHLPFGYIIANPATFNFDRFQTSAFESRGEANRGSSILAVNYYRRPADTTQTTASLQAGLFLNSAKRKVTYSADTTSYNVRHVGANVRKWLKAGPLTLEGAASAGYFINKNNVESSLDTGNWGLISGEAAADFQPVRLLRLNVEGNYRTRTDGYSDSRLGIEATILPWEKVSLSAGITTGSRMPTPQQLYWQAVEFTGSNDLKKEQIQELHATLNIKPFNGMKVGLRSAVKQIDNGIMIDADSTYSNENSYSALSTAAFAGFNNTHFELSGSATIQQFGSFLKSRVTPLPVNENQRVWFKGSAYAKGYLFNRATYVKAGIAGVISPQAYQTARYYPSLDFWQSSGATAIPAFNRLDVDLSARVRSIMVLLRYENVLDDVTQLGYFETAGYPMPRRRFIFGIRVLFRN